MPEDASWRCDPARSPSSEATTPWSRHPDGVHRSAASGPRAPSERPFRPTPRARRGAQIQLIFSRIRPAGLEPGVVARDTVLIDQRTGLRRVLSRGGRAGPWPVPPAALAAVAHTGAGAAARGADAGAVPPDWPDSNATEKTADTGCNKESRSHTVLSTRTDPACQEFSAENRPGRSGENR